MEPKEVINELLHDQGRSRRSLAKQVGMSPQALDNLLTKAKSMRIDRFTQLLDALGYDMRIVPREVVRPEFTLSGPNEGKPQD